ncbi:MAG: TonB-dependent receptor plug domain-containing protein [Flavisolibacter sp.]
MRKIFVVTAILFSSQLHAQQVDSSKTMDEVTLTANKFSTKTTETGKVVTIISRNDIDHAGSRDLAQVITELGGVFINGYSSNGGKEKNLYLRGGKVEHTLILIDGMPVYDASGIAANFDIRNIPVDHVERIEILKGSQSTLYGSDAIAGVVNIITRKGGKKPFTVSGTAHYGSFDTWRANISVNGHVNIFDYNIGYTHFNSKGFSEAQKPENSTAIFDKDPFRENSVQANFGIQAAKNFRIQPFFRYTKFIGSIDEDAFTDANDYINENKNAQAGVRNILGLGKAQLNLLYQYTHTDRIYLNDSLQPSSYFIYSEQNYSSKEHFAEGFIVYPFNNLKLTTGLDMRSSNTGYSAIQKNIFSPIVEYDSYNGDSVHHLQTGIYAALNYSKNNFNIEGGARLNNHSEYGNNFAFNFNPSYFIQKRVKVFANISSGYKVPSLYQLFSIYGNKELHPESSLNFETGFQYFTKDAKLNFRATYFNRYVKDVIAFFFNSTTFQSNFINQDEQNDHGFELELTAKFSEKFQLRAMYGYVDGEITTKQNGKDTTYFNLLRRPKGTFNIFLGSQITKSFYASLQMNAIGERKDLYFDASFVRHDVVLDSYMLLNFYTEYALLKNRLKLFVDLRNLTDKKYSDIVGYNTAGFNAYGGFRFQF